MSWVASRAGCSRAPTAARAQPPSRLLAPRTRARPNPPRGTDPLQFQAERSPSRSPLSPVGHRENLRVHGGQTSPALQTEPKAAVRPAAKYKTPLDVVA